MILKNAKLISPKNELEGIFDLKIENGIITEIGTDFKRGDIDLKGLIAVSGFIDMHCHLREPGFEYKETIVSGINSAIAGGYCGICPMANTFPVNDNSETLTYIKNRDNRINIYPICAMTMGLKSEKIVDFKVLKNGGAIAFSDDGLPYRNENLLIQGLNSGNLIISHAEKLELAGTCESEYSAIDYELNILRKVNGKMHFAHVSCKKSVDLIRNAKKEGLNVTAETAPHYFSLFADKKTQNDPIFKVNPHLRSKRDVEAIIEGLKDGTIDVIATDHAPHSVEDKQKPYEQSPNGFVGFETAVGLAFTNLRQYLTFKQIVEKFSTNPSKILGLKGFGEIKVGNTANLTIIDPDKKWTVKGENFKSKCKFSPFEGIELVGKPVGAVIKGVYYENK